MIRVAIGTAKVLGLADIKVDVLPTTAHVMNTGRCMFDCKFCTQARSSTSDGRLLSRIAWPEYEEDKVLELLRKKQHKFKRVCLQVVHSDSNENFLKYVKKIRACCDIPVSVDLKADDLGIIKRTFEAGADVVGMPIDAANPDIYSKIKEGSFHSHMKLIRQAALEFPGKISTHLMIGLGESEKDAVEIIRKMHDLGVTLGLFAFTPIKGTALEKMNRPSLEHYRRIQMARFLIINDLAQGIRYGEKGRIVDFGYGPEELKEIIKPSAFQTSGCPDCNRPFYNETPGKELYNYPYVPSKKEYTKALNDVISSLEGEHG